MILWLTPKRGLSPTAREIVTKTLMKYGIKPAEVLFLSLHNRVAGFGDHTKKKMPDKDKINAALHTIKLTLKQLQQVNLIVVNDESTLRALTGAKHALGTVRGSKYFFENVPCIVVDDLNSLRYSNHARFNLQFDLAKIIRHATGKIKQEPKFHFHVCRTLADVQFFCDLAEQASLLASDVETGNGFITVESITFNTKDGYLCTFCVPYFNPFKDDGCHWSTFEIEKQVRRCMQKLHASPAYKVGQNYIYDCAYFIKEGSPPKNWLFDTQNMMHALWAEAPKKLHNIASYFLDCYTYWKDDKKGIEEDGWGQDTHAMEKYWRYNGLDTYYTWLGCSELLNFMRVTDWAIANYNTTIRCSAGPCLAGSLRGLLVDQSRHAQIIATKSREAAAGIADMRRLTGEPDYNPNSTQDNGWFLYDVLGAKKTRLQRKNSKYGERSTDEKVLRLIQEQRNVIINNFIKRLERAKKPANVVSNFGNLYRLCYKGRRFLSMHNATGTDTGRFSSTSSQFWTGRNAQNTPPELKEMFVADPDYVICELDWSASDDYFIAHEAEELDKIALLHSGKDTHCWHASIFFKKPYEEILAGKKAEPPAEWVVDPITGVRQVAKKTVHGKNFMMGPGMLYNLMGRDALVATAKALGHANASAFSDKELIGICAYLMDVYDDPRKGMYKRIRPWQAEAIAACAKNGNLATCAFGMTRRFFGDMENDSEKHRQLCAFFGQGGTAGNANRALNSIFYSGIDDGRTVLFIFQVHDSLVFLIHRAHLHKIGQIKAIMEEPTTIKGRQFFVPVEAKVGLTRSENMLKWKPTTTYAEIAAFEKKHFEAKFPKDGSAMLDELANLNFDETLIADLSKQLAQFGEQDESDLNDDPELVSMDEEF